MTAETKPPDSPFPSEVDATTENVRPSKVISRKTSQLPTLSKLIYHIDHYTSMSIVVVVFTAGLIATLIVGAVLGFPNSWVVHGSSPGRCSGAVRWPESTAPPPRIPLSWPRLMPGM